MVTDKKITDKGITNTVNASFNVLRASNGREMTYSGVIDRAGKWSSTSEGFVCPLVITPNGEGSVSVTRDTSPGSGTVRCDLPGTYFRKIKSGVYKNAANNLTLTVREATTESTQITGPGNPGVYATGAVLPTDRGFILGHRNEAESTVCHYALAQIDDVTVKVTAYSQPSECKVANGLYKRQSS